MLVSDFIADFRALVGDTTLDAPDEFLITGLNWALRDLPVNPKLEKIFSRHFTVQLDAERHWRWDLSATGQADEADYFDYILDLEYLNVWTSTGGDVCPLGVCQVSEKELYGGGIPELMSAGKPCNYALARNEDKLYFVLDRPSDVPIILDYVAYGIPHKVSSMNDEAPISTLVENAILSVLRTIWYMEASDMAFAGSIYDYLDNKYIPQLVQEINKRFGSEPPAVLGR